ncbi:hypothetical protein NEUTE2DRAFT_78310 [Neurospora tetrasperma FGSC 2509]|nr:hypothetical protein NEUTE2DRAFT_78310 [Neurospora tetrasperma FGSC 2509]
MNNFGVIEVASQKTKNAPGWAYVPDTGLTPAAAAALQPLNRKRAARDKANVGAPDLTARQDAKIRKDLEALDKDSHRDAQIPIPPKAGGTRAQNKHTPNVRKILQSQKTFANHLDDYQAFLALAESNPQLAAQVNKPTPTTTTTTTATTTARNSPAPSTITTANPTTTETRRRQRRYGTILPAYNRPPPTPHPGDDDPLLVSHVPPFPTDEELRALITAPPLSYLEARAQWTEEEEGRYPARRFCEVCGYWGRVKCIKCGARVCALECLEAHREECLVRYGL